MENQEFIKRIADLADRCERTGSVTYTGFLTPAEQYALKALHIPGEVTLRLTGGGQGCENMGFGERGFHKTAASGKYKNSNYKTIPYL